LHDEEFDVYARSVALNNFETAANMSVKYSLTVYPTNVMFSEFATNSPVGVSIGFVAVILICTCIFFVYDFFVKHEAHQRKMILEMKRRFVRFVSHEIRTPLNTVSMGLDLLQGELSVELDKKNKLKQDHNKNNNDKRNKSKEKNNNDIVKSASSGGGDDNEIQGGGGDENGTIATAAIDSHDTDDDDINKTSGAEDTASNVAYWLDLTSNILENTHNAVSILDDLLVRTSHTDGCVMQHM
jgi:signal transduction histidine kinase